MKKKWIYQIRAVAVIAVVICHQQGLLHSSELVQLLTLYSVSLFVLCMGITKAISLNNFNLKYNQIKNYTLTKYTVNSMQSCLSTYLVATIAYLVQMKLFTIETFFNSLLNFNASAPLYFIRYYIVFSIIAPVLFSMVKIIYNLKLSKLMKMAAVSLFLLSTFVVGYLTLDTYLYILGGSYLFIYSSGLVIGLLIEYEEPLKIKIRHYILGLFLFLIGLYSTKIFYFERVAGNFTYNKGIDCLTPKLQMNPPNISIIVYSFGCFFLCYCIFNKFNFSKLNNNKTINMLLDTFTLLGKYSLDIFIWHILIQSIFKAYLPVISNIWLMRGVYYGGMFFIPIVMRLLYIKLRGEIYKVLLFKI